MTLVVILAGGAGRRMNGNKPFHPFAGATLIEAVAARLKPQASLLYVNAGSKFHPLADAFTQLGLPLVFDDHLANMGPLSGILSALTLARHLVFSEVITVPCDMPDLPMDLVQQLINAPDADVAFMAGVRDHPLCARWRLTVEAPLRQALEAAAPSGGLSVMRFVETLKPQRIPVDNERQFLNLNMLKDF